MKTARVQFVVDDKGKKTAVILPVEKYEQLLEDLHDLAVIAERREEQPMDFQAMKARLKENGDEKT
ncbi:MAG: type II toxin-antitoxin system Phd/YefM family antitoxin [Candidatus Heimdallarchaeota archaeon]